MEQEPQIVRMPRLLEWGLLALCAISLIVYLLQSRAAEKYLGTYLMLLGKLPTILGN